MNGVWQSHGVAWLDHDFLSGLHTLYTLQDGSWYTQRATITNFMTQVFTADLPFDIASVKTLYTKRVMARVCERVDERGEYCVQYEAIPCRVHATEAVISEAAPVECVQLQGGCPAKPPSPPYIGCDTVDPAHNRTCLDMIRCHPDAVTIGSTCETVQTLCADEALYPFACESPPPSPPPPASPPTVCPCLTLEQLPDTIFYTAARHQLVSIEGELIFYPTEYGVGCGAHDAGLRPHCDSSSAPAWCYSTCATSTRRTATSNTSSPCTISTRPTSSTTPMKPAKPGRSSTTLRRSNSATSRPSASSSSALSTACSRPDTTSRSRASWIASMSETFCSRTRGTLRVIE